jgi:hypothetical protein
LYIPEFLRGFISLEKSVGSGSEFSGLKVHPLDEKRPDADLHMSFDAAISVFALGGSEIHA